MHHHSRPYLDALATERLATADALQRRRDDDDLTALVVAAAEGDASAWSGLVERYTARMRGVARQQRVASHDIDDVVQTTWLRLLEHIDRLRDPRAVGAWLEVTARRECLSVLQKGERERPAPVESLGEPATPPIAERRLVEAERRVALAGALDRLPRHQGQLLRLMLAEPDRSYADISSLLAMPVGSIGPTRARSLERLRRDVALAGSLG